MAVAIPHDEERWGSPITDDGQQVVRLADLLRATKGSRPWQAAVREDLGRLGAAGPLRWVYFRCGQTVRELSDGEVWRAGKASGAELLKELDDMQAKGVDFEFLFNTQLSGLRRQDYFFSRAELAARGVLGLVKGDELGVGYKNREAFEKVPGVAGLCGASGLLTYAAEQWAELQRGDQLDHEPAVSLVDRPSLSRVGLCVSDTERLLGGNPAGSGQSATAGQKSALAQAMALAAERLNECETLPSRPKEDRDRLLLKQFKMLTEGPSPLLKAKNAHEAIGLYWKLSTLSVKTYLRDARKL